MTKIEKNKKSVGIIYVIKTKLLFSIKRFEIVIWVICKTKAIIETMIIGTINSSPGFFENFSKIRGINAKLKI